jgi:predicted MFS family arabinose efflux permease
VAAAAFGVGAVIEGPRLGWTSIQTLGGLGLAAVALWAFVVRERRVRDPLLDLSLFGDRAVAAGASAIALAFFALFGFTFAITMYFQSIRGYSALGAGLAIVPFAIVMSAGSPLAPQLALRFGAQRCICGGLVLMGAGFLVVSFANESSSYWLVMVPAMILMAAGLSFIQGPATDIIMTAAPRDRVGVVSAVNDSIREIGGTIGVAVLGSVLAYEYSTNMSQIAASSPILAPASHSIMAARQVAEAMPASSMREELVRVATDSFINALRMDCLILTVVTLIAALGVGLVFPSGNRCKLSVDPAGS